MWLGRATMGSQWSEKRCSRPVSRILSRHRSLPFGSNDREDDHSSSPGIADGIQQPTRKPQAGRLFSRQERSPRPKCLPIWSCSVWGFACRVCYQPRGALLPHLFTLTCPKAGGMFSVPLSVGLPRPGVTRRTALWSSDFPLPHALRTPRPVRAQASGYAQQRSSGRLQHVIIPCRAIESDVQ